MRNLPGICHLPNQLYKFYRFDPQFNESRLKGEIYLANALQFNDPLDCRIDVLNNTKDKAPEFYLDGWLDHKLRELNFRGKYQREEIGNNLLNDDRDTVQMVWQKQLEKMGIICLTPEIDNILMWGYYTDNKGFCIEYNTENLIHDIVIGYVNALDYDITQHLYEKREYKVDPFEIKSYRLLADQLAIAEHYANLFSRKDIDLITNDWLRNQEQESIENKLNFLKNILCQRMGADSIRYDAERFTDPPKLFLDKSKESIISKYYRKNSIWKHEKEFRITCSLGGMKLIRLCSANWIKSIHLGCYMDRFRMLQIAYLLYEQQLTDIPVYRMYKNNQQGLSKVEVDLSRLKNSFAKIDMEMDSVFEAQNCSKE